MTSTFTAGAVAFIAGCGLAIATAVGVVQSQQNAGTDPVQTTNVSYGNN